MKKIAINEEFILSGWVMCFSEDNGSIRLKKVREAGKTKEFVPPTLEEVKEYFKKEGYKEDVAIRAYRHYSSAEWHNSKGKKVLNWKQTMGTNWMTPENKIEDKKTTPQDNMVR